VKKISLFVYAVLILSHVIFPVVAHSSDWSENFNDGVANDWQIVSGSWSVCQVNGQYSYCQTNMSNGDSDTPHLAYYKGRQFDNFTASVDVKYTTGVGGGRDCFGIVYRYKDYKNYYWLFINPNYSSSKPANLIKVVNGVQTSVMQVATINSAAHNLRIEISGDHHIVKKDGVKIIDVYDNSHTSGYIGAATSKLSGSFDNFMVQSSTPLAHPAKEFFDDFRYSEPTDVTFKAHGWIVQDIDNTHGPGIPGTWRIDRVTFASSGDATDNAVMRLSAKTDGTEGGTKQADVGTKERFKFGTFAVRARLTDYLIGYVRDRLVEAPLFLISDPEITVGEPYSECDFEYLPNGSNWDGTDRIGPQLFATSWKTAEDKDKISSPSPNDSGISYEGWHIFIIYAFKDGVTYLVIPEPSERKPFASHSYAYAPDTKMRIAFQMWFNRLGWDYQPREYEMDIDWVYHAGNANLTAEEIENFVSDIRASGASYRDTFPKKNNSWINLLLEH